MWHSEYLIQKIISYRGRTISDGQLLDNDDFDKPSDTE